MLETYSISATRLGNSQQNQETVGITARPPLDLALFRRPYRDASKFDHDQVDLYICWNGENHETCMCKYQWIGLRENLQETMVFTIKYRGFL